MKNNLLTKVLLLLLLFALCLSLIVSCGSNTETQATNEQTNETSQSDNPDETDAWDYTRSPELPDYATQVKLNTSNLETDFDLTGRGLVTVEQMIDGDTVHFWNYSKTTIIKVRFLAIDTPESTGRVEPWGKQASNYTKERLRNAYQIVLESDKEGTTSFDSTGERYLAWVWYKPSEDSEWRNLNIEILADGLAMGKVHYQQDTEQLQ